ncbi:MAG: glycosyltransferase family 1 protein [Lachnospiraceae bacterium]|nr:glycosyltransferase family 1 protein [Lachnospiraceae bacterium]
MEKYGTEIIEENGKKKVLIVTACDLSGGGVPVFLYNMLSNMDLEAFCIHIYFPGEIILQQLADKFLNMGLILYIGGCSTGGPVREIAYHDLDYLTSLYNYDVIHSNSGKVWINYYSCYFGIKNNIPLRIVHSHSALLPRKNPEIQKQDDIYRKFIKENATDFLACSAKAAEWLYGAGFNEYMVFKNGIHLEKYQFSEDTRIKYRKGLSIGNRFVIGHVGRFVEAKNHEFLLNIFREVLKTSSNCVLLMAGGGELLEDIKEKAERMELSSNCIFLGERMDVQELLQAMDVFVFPSLFEGLGIAVIEAQASGLPCITSDEIPEEACVPGGVLRIPLEKTASYWAEQVLKYKAIKKERKANCMELKAEGYNVQDSARRLWELYKRNP